jgi:large subunit ribosomal protein L15
MISLHTLRASSQRRHPKRVGRGNASGKGTTAGRGTKGQRARTGGRNKAIRRSLRALIERTPKVRGFRSRREPMEIVTVAQLISFFSSDQVITPVKMVELKLIRRTRPGVKIVGATPTAKKLTVKANGFSAGAKAAIEKAGGHAIVIKPTV